MPFLLLAAGLALGLYGLYRFFIKATPKQVIAFFIAGFFVVTLLAAFFLAITGRLPAAIALVTGLAPLAYGVYKPYLAQKSGRRAETKAASAPGAMTRAEALDVLGIPDGASREEIKTAYKRLIKKVHPDQEGSAWMAAKLNEAHDMLTRDDGSRT